MTVMLANCFAKIRYGSSLQRQTTPVLPGYWRLIAEKFAQQMENAYGVVQSAYPKYEE
jgi:hypothetical protein